MCHHGYGAYEPADDREAVDVPGREEADPEPPTPEAGDRPAGPTATD